MFVRSTLASLLLLAISAVPLRAADPAPRPAPTLATLRPGHPRLIFTPELEASLRARVGTDPLLARLVTHFRQRSDALADSPTEPYQSTPFAEFGFMTLELNRKVLERVTIHAFLYRLTGERVYADRLWREVEAALAYPSWNPEHFLSAAEMLVAMAFAYDWAYDAWTPEQRATLRQAMIERAVKRGLEIHETHEGLSAFFATSASNWNSVCNAGLLAAVLAIAEDEPDLAARVLAHAVPSLARPKSGFEPDGASQEGATYWSYGTEFFCLAGILLQSALSDDAGLLSGNGIAKTCLYRLHVQAPSRRNYNYADAWRHTELPAAFAFLSQRFGPAPARQAVRDLLAAALDKPGGDSNYRLAPLLALYLPPAEPPAAAADAPLDAFFGGTTEVAMMRSAWGDARAAYLGFKAGHVTHGHNHLDAGSFFFEQAGVRWATDLGPDRYTLPNYFRTEGNKSNQITDANRHEPTRWSYFRNINYSHNTLTLGGDLQSRDAVAPFIAKGSTPARSFAVADLSSIYPGRAQSWKRGAAFVDRKWVAIRDELTGLASGLPVEWVMLTEASVSIADDARSATLTHKDETLHLQLTEAPAAARLSATPALPPTAAEDQNKGITRVAAQWSASSADEVIEVHLVPAADPMKPDRSSLGRLSDWNAP